VAVDGSALVCHLQSLSSIVTFGYNAPTLRCATVLFLNEEEERHWHPNTPSIERDRPLLALSGHLSHGHPWSGLRRSTRREPFDQFGNGASGVHIVNLEE
jgi:hypothetical protein